MIPIEIVKNIGSSIPFLRQAREQYSHKRSDLLSNVERPFTIFEDMLKRVGNSLDLRDKVILEVGPGNSLGIGLLFLAHGARKVYLIDRFKHLFWDVADVDYHKRVLENIKDRKFPFAHSAAEAVSFAVNSITFDTSRMEYRVGDTAALPVDNDTIDLIFSNAVLEHVHHIKAAVAEFSRVTRTEGMGIHEIDLRDHFFHQTPLRLLEYQDWLWNLMSWYRPGYSNRLRLSDYVDLFENSGLCVQQKLVTKRYAGVVEEVKLSNKFKRYSLDELAVLTFWLTVKKGKK